MPGGTGTPVTSHDYAILATVKSRLGITDTADDIPLASNITTASRWIDDRCERRFYAATETRYYKARRSDRLAVDDLLSVSSLQTDDDGDRTYENTWGSTDYYLEPANAPLEGKPYDAIEVDAANGDYSFPVGVQRGVKVTGSFGYSASTPSEIEEACILRTAQLHYGINAPFNVIGEAGNQMQFTPSQAYARIMDLISTFRRISVG